MKHLQVFFEEVEKSGVKRHLQCISGVNLGLYINPSCKLVITTRRAQKMSMLEQAQTLCENT